MCGQKMSVFVICSSDGPMEVVGNVVGRVVEEVADRKIVRKMVVEVVYEVVNGWVYGKRRRQDLGK